MFRYVALLRGVNVGGKNRVQMADVAAAFHEAGCGSVQTYIQSGNVLFDAQCGTKEQFAELLERRLEKRFGFGIPVVIRTRAELARVTRQNPFFGPDVREESLHVYFLSKAPNVTDVAGLDPDRSKPDEFIVRGQEIYLRLPNGIGRTKLTNAYFDSKLHTVTTARNWRTILQLQELMKSSTSAG